MVGSKIIDRALSCMTAGELAHTTMTWQQAHFGAVMLGSLQLSHSSSDKPKPGEKLENSSWENDPMEVWKSQLDGVKGAVCTTQKVTIPLFHTVKVRANASVKWHCMKVHVLTEPVLGPQLPAAVVPIATYGELHPGSSRVPVCLCNLSAHAMEIPAKTVVGQVIPANQIPLVVPLNQACCRDGYQRTQRMGLGDFRPPWPKRVAQVRAEMGLGSCCSNGNIYLYTAT